MHRYRDELTRRCIIEQVQDLEVVHNADRTGRVNTSPDNVTGNQSRSKEFDSTLDGANDSASQALRSAQGRLRNLEPSYAVASGDCTVDFCHVVAILACSYLKATGLVQRHLPSTTGSERHLLVRVSSAGRRTHYRNWHFLAF